LIDSVVLYFFFFSFSYGGFYEKGMVLIVCAYGSGFRSGANADWDAENPCRLFFHA
jgi:hypothetical protein